MRLPRAIAPRDRASAARTLLLAGTFSLVATAGWEVAVALTDPRAGGSGSAVESIGFAVALLAGAWVCYRWPHRVPGLTYPAFAVLGPVMTLSVALISRDASAAGQFGLVYPVVYAAAHFRPAFAWLIAAWAVGASTAIATSILATPAAIGDVVVIAPTLVMVTLVLLTVAGHQERLVLRLNELAAVDPLTGLATRRELESVAARLLGAPGAAARRRSDGATGVGLVLIDIDNFKHLNDSFGHPVGDAALTHVAQLVRSRVRASDVVARLGGDELAILIQGGPDEVGARAREVHEAVRGTHLPQLDGGALTVSVGVAASDDGRPTFADLYAAADRALYEAKASGRDALATAAVPV